MSPFTLATGELVSCMTFGRERPLEHAGSCSCPCPPCVLMQRAVLECIGLLRADTRPRRIFLHAYGTLRVSHELLLEDDVESWFLRSYRAIEDSGESRESPPSAAFGWLVPAARKAGALVVVKAPSDPSEGRMEEALAAWAAEHGLELLDPLDQTRM